MPTKRRFPVGALAAPAKGPADLSPIANPGSNRYQYPACFVSSRLSSLIQIPEFSERPRIVPHEVLNGLNVLARALSPNKISPVCSFLNISVWNTSFSLVIPILLVLMPQPGPLLQARSPFRVEQPIEKCA